MRALDSGRAGCSGFSGAACRPVRESFLHAQQSNRLEQMAVTQSLRSVLNRAAYGSGLTGQRDVACVSGSDIGMREPGMNGGQMGVLDRRVNERPSSDFRIRNKSVLLWVAQ